MIALQSRFQDLSDLRHFSLHIAELFVFLVNLNSQHSVVDAERICPQMLLGKNIYELKV